MAEKNAFAQLEGLIKELGQFLASMMPPGFGFVLTIYRHGHEPGRTRSEQVYISTSKREDVVLMLRELAGTLEHGADAPFGADGHPARNMGPKS